MLILSVLVYRKHLLKEMIERLTVHLRKKKEEYKETGFEKSKINIVDQGNTKF